MSSLEKDMEEYIAQMQAKKRHKPDTEDDDFRARLKVEVALISLRLYLKSVLIWKTPNMCMKKLNMVVCRVFLIGDYFFIKNMLLIIIQEV